MRNAEAVKVTPIFPILYVPAFVFDSGQVKKISRVFLKWLKKEILQISNKILEIFVPFKFPNSVLK